MPEPEDQPGRIVTDLGELAGVSDRGFAHEHNEDAMALGRAPDGTVAAVLCDGVSTSFAPEQAARTAADVALDVLLTSAEPAPERVRSAVTAAAAKVAALARDSGGRSSSCTLVCGLLHQVADAPAEITIGWVGDSRAYWLAPTGARLLTSDHSWAMEMVIAGVLDESAAMRDPRAHAITRWLGATGSPEPEVATLRPDAPGVLLLCTDGLWNYFPDPAELAEVTLPTVRERGPLAAAAELTGMALDAGGRDNITVAVIPA